MRSIPALAAVVSALAVSLVWAGPAEAAPKVAVIDMTRAIQEHPRAKVVEDNFRKAQQEAQENLKAAEQQLEDLKRKIDKMDEKEPARAQQELNYASRLATMKVNFEFARRRAVRKYTESLEQLYKVVQGEVARVAREREIEIVLTFASPDRPMNAGSPEDFALKSRLRTVVHAAGSVDLTQTVIDRLKKKPN